MYFSVDKREDKGRWDGKRGGTKVTGGFFTEKAALKIVFSILIRAEKRWRRVPMEEMEINQINALRKCWGEVLKEKRKRGRKCFLK